MTASPQNTDFNNENSDVNNQLSNLEEDCKTHSVKDIVDFVMFIET